MNDFVLRGNICYSADPDTILIRERAYAVCTDGVCRGVFDELPGKYRDLPLTDYDDRLIIPGLCDLHLHAPQYAYRGLGMDMELLDWLNTYAFPEETKYASVVYAERAYSMLCEALKASATTRAVVFASIHPASTALLMEMLERTGIVSYVGKVNMDRNSPDTYIETTTQSAADTKRWLEDTIGRFKNTYPIITPRFVPSCTDELMAKLGSFAAQYNVPVQSHLSENLGEVEWVKELCPDDPFYGAAYDRHGLFGSTGNCVMAHCVYSSDEEIALMKERGVFVAHCPASNMNVGSGIAPIRRYLDAGLNIGLGSDVAGGHTESLFTAMVEAIQNSKLYWRVIDNDKKPLSFENGFYLATRGGGKFFGEVGAFEEGWEFDAVVLSDHALPHPQTLTIREKLERAVYLGADVKGMTAKYCRGKRIL